PGHLLSSRFAGRDLAILPEPGAPSQARGAKGARRKARYWYALERMPIPSFTAMQLRAGAPGRDTALTIGVLDGVHLGHQALLRCLAAEARARTLSPGVVTLHPHPITVLRPEIQPSYLTSLERRMELMLAAGMDWVIPLTFTSEVAEVEAEELATAFHELLRMRLMV